MNKNKCKCGAPAEVLMPSIEHPAYCMKCLEKKFRQEFIDAVNEDNTPKALAVVNESLKSNLSGDIKLDMILDFDKDLDLLVEGELIVANNK